MSPSPRALDGMLVLDVGSFIAGPPAATVMSDFGAEVIKVESPGGGDPIINFYRCKDDRWFMLTVLRADKGWEPFTRAIERPDAAGITTLRRLGVIAP